MGREDCSLCHHANATYPCVWCAATHTCVYRQLCRLSVLAQCPNPEITDVSQQLATATFPDRKAVILNQTVISLIIIFQVIISFLLQIIPRFGPLNGRISVTIKGSNMGIKKEDIKKITVAGVDCVHQEDRYSVSTRYSS